MKFSNEEARECFERGNAALGRADLAVAKAELQRCVELAPDSADAWCYLGMALTVREPGPAALALDRALALDPGHHGSLYWRAEVHWLQGDPGSAAKLLQHLNDIVPGVSANLGRLGLAYLAAGNNQAAMRAFRQAVEAGDGIESVTGSHAELRRAIYLNQLDRGEEALRLIRRVNARGVELNYPRARYPRELEEQRCALEDIVAGRDIVILGSGPSLEQLDPLLRQLGPDGSQDLCFFGFNNVPVAERLLRDAIGRGVELACMTSAAVMDLHTEWISTFLAETTPGLFMTAADALTPGRATADMIGRRADKLFFFAASGDYPPIPEDPLHFPPINTLMCVLPLAVLAQPRNIFLFGCDGAAPVALENGGPVYFRQGSPEYGKQDVANTQYARWLERDTFFFNCIISTVLSCLSALHRVPIPPIFICNPNSSYRCFPRIEGKDFLQLHRSKTTKHHIYPARLHQLSRRVDALSACLQKAAQERKGKIDASAKQGSDTVTTRVRRLATRARHYTGRLARFLRAVLKSP